MLEIVLICGFAFLVACLFLLISFCMIYCCRKVRRKTNPNIELGLVSSSVSQSLKSVEKSKTRISEPVILNGKLYGQDYFAIKERLGRTGTLFVDDKVRKKTQ